MIRKLISGGTVALFIGLAACGGEQDVGGAKEGQSTAAVPAESTPGRDLVATARGTVTAKDLDAGVVTISHEPVTELGWPAMTMAFPATAAVLAAASEGSSVEFEITIARGRAQITDLRAQ